MYCDCYFVSEHKRNSIKGGTKELLTHANIVTKSLRKFVRVLAYKVVLFPIEKAVTIHFFESINLSSF